uniref:Uncharacterized protein n=1 Tax=Zea mays TaxID=4577 RepID=A0A804LMQ1_MAIZE
MTSRAAAAAANPYVRVPHRLKPHPGEHPRRQAPHDVGPLHSRPRLRRRRRRPLASAGRPVREHPLHRRQLLPLRAPARAPATSGRRAPHLHAADVQASYLEPPGAVARRAQQPRRLHDGDHGRAHRLVPPRRVAHLDGRHQGDAPVRGTRLGPLVRGHQRVEHARVPRGRGDLERRVLVGHLGLDRQRVHGHGLQLLQGEGENFVQRLRVVTGAPDARGDALAPALGQGHGELPDEPHGPRGARARALGASPADHSRRDALKAHLLGRLPRNVIHAAERRHPVAHLVGAACRRHLLEHVEPCGRRGARQHERPGHLHGELWGPISVPQRQVERVHGHQEPAVTRLHGRANAPPQVWHHGRSRHRLPCWRRRLGSRRQGQPELLLVADTVRLELPKKLHRHHLFIRVQTLLLTRRPGRLLPAVGHQRLDGLDLLGNGVELPQHLALSLVVDDFFNRLNALLHDLVLGEAVHVPGVGGGCRKLVVAGLPRHQRSYRRMMIRISILVDTKPIDKLLVGPHGR